MGIRIVVAEDSLLVREGILQILAYQPDIQTIGSCGDLPSLAALIAADPPDVVLTDVRMPPDHTDEGVRFAVSARTEHPALGVVVLSQYAEPGYATALLSGGSARRGYLLKERVSEPDQLAAAIRTIAAGGSVIDPTIVDMLLTTGSQSASSPLSSLTGRELEVLDGIAQGKSNAAVAASLYLSERAVEKHINSLFAKLGLAATPDVNRRVSAVLLHLSHQA